MIKQKDILIKIGTRNTKYFKDLGYNNVIFGKELLVKIKDLKDGCKIKLNVTCDVCKNDKIIQYVKYINSLKKGGYYTCSKCSKYKVKKTNLEKYGVEYPLQNKDILDKVKKTNLEKYGVENVFKTKNVKDKSKKTNLEKYGVEYANQNPIFIEKIKNTVQEKYGVDHVMHIEEVKEKIRKTNLEKYGFEYATQSEKVKNKTKITTFKKYGVENVSQSTIIKNIIKFNNNKKYGVDYYLQSDERHNVFLKNKKESIIKIGIKTENIINYDLKNRCVIHCDKCAKDYNITTHLLKQRIKKYNIEPCLNCNPLNSLTYPTSKGELELLQFIKDNYLGTIIEGDRKILERKELDIYLPDLNLAFEFNGVYWHSELHKEKDYHIDKTEDCLNKNIQLIHIYEDDWNYKQEIVKSRILNLLSKSKRIYARKTDIREVDSKKARSFLNNNHIQGFVGSKVKLGLYYDNELVSLMTFGSLRKNLGQVSKEGSYELLRFCNLLNFTVIGGASKLFKHFIKNYSPKDIISYADRSWSKGGLYENLGFEFIKNTGVNYFYVIDGIKENRFGYRKDILVKEGYDSSTTEHEIMISRDIYRIYDSGSMKFLWK